jgi:heterodisulfide reductase subunit A
MAIQNALEIKKKDPSASVYVLYRDVRTYGFRETYYKRAREAGVVFIRYIPEAKPIVSDKNGLTVTVTSPDFPEPITIETDTVVLSAGIESTRDNNRRISDILKVPLNSDGFYHRPKSNCGRWISPEGIFLCGLAIPKFIDETICRPGCCRSRGHQYYRKRTDAALGPVCGLIESASLHTCVTVCPYGAIGNANGKG